MKHRQILVLRGVLAGTVSALTVIYLGWTTLPSHIVSQLSACERLLFTVRCEFASWLCFLIASCAVTVQQLLQRVPLGEEEEEGGSEQPLQNQGGKQDEGICLQHTAEPTARALELNSKFARHTLELVALSCAGHLALSTFLDASSVRIIPVLVFNFILGRGIHWYGFYANLWTECVGFAMSFVPTVVVYIVCAYEIIVKGLLHLG